MSVQRAIQYIVFSLTWPTSMQIYWNKRKRLHKTRVQLPQDWFGTPTWPPFHCLGHQYGRRYVMWKHFNLLSKLRLRNTNGLLRGSWICREKNDRLRLVITAEYKPLNWPCPVHLKDMQNTFFCIHYDTEQNALVSDAILNFLPLAD